MAASNDKGYLQAIENTVFRLVELSNEAEAAGLDPDEMVAKAYTDDEYGEQWLEVDDIMRVIADTYQLHYDAVCEDVNEGMMIQAMKEIEAFTKGLH